MRSSSYNILAHAQSAHLDLATVLVSLMLQPFNLATELDQLILQTEHSLTTFPRQEDEITQQYLSIYRYLVTVNQSTTVLLMAINQ